MLEFHISIFEKLYKAAEIMNIGVLSKLLDAQRKSHPARPQRRKFDDVISTPLAIKPVPKPSAPEIPPALPIRKAPIWKRKTPSSSSQFDSHDKWHGDSPSGSESSRPKPTRFEWPDEELPSLSLLDSTFEEISYTSKPLLTQEEEIRVSSNANTSTNCSEDLKQTSPSHSKKSPTKIMVETAKEVKQVNKNDSSGFEESKF